MLEKDISNLISQYKADIATGKRDQSHLLSTKNSHLTHPAAGLEALDVDAEVVVGVVGQGGVGVEDGGHGGRIQVARVGVHLQLQLGALWLPGQAEHRRLQTEMFCCHLDQLLH